MGFELGGAGEMEFEGEPLCRIELCAKGVYHRWIWQQNVFRVPGGIL